MATYSVNEIIGKTLIAKRPIKLVRYAADNATEIFTVQPGQSVGIVNSYLLPNEERSAIYWSFDDANGRPYYTKHAAGYFDIKSLQEAGALTVQEQAEQAAEAEMTTGDKILNTVKNVAYIAAVVYLINSFIKNK